MENVNNCAECGHHKMQRTIEKNDPQSQPLHCYMFKDVPEGVCMQHTARKMLNFPIQTAIHEMVEDLIAKGNHEVY